MPTACGVYRRRFFYRPKMRLRRFAATAAISVTPDLIVIPRNHITNPIKIIMTGTGTSFSSSTVMTPDHGTTDHIEVQSSTVLWYFYNPDATYTGTVTVTESVTGTATATFTVAEPTISLSPNTGVTGVTIPITITSTAAVYLQEVPSELFTVAPGATISNITVVDNVTCTADLLLPAGSTGTTVTDRSTYDYAPASFGLAAATTYTVSPSPTTNGTLDVAKTFTFRADGLTGDVVTGGTDGSGSWAGTITLDDTNAVQQTYTETVTIGAVTLSFMNSGTLIDADDITLYVHAFADNTGDRLRRLLRP